MILSAPLLNIFKYSFLGLVVTGAGFLIANTAVTMHYKSEKMEQLAYRAQPFPRNVSLSLHRNSLLCLTHPSKPFCLMSSKKRLQLLRHHYSHAADRLSDNVTKTPSSRPFHPFYLLMKDFVDFANSLKVAPILLEPSILYCMLSTQQKYSVISNNLQTKTLLKSPNTITFGVFERDSRLLTQESSVKRSSELGYEFSRFREWLNQNGDLVDTSFSFSRQNLTVIVIVFFQRETFMWHPGLLEKNSSFQSLQFASNHAYENFTAAPFLFESGHQNGFHLPSETAHFLLQVQRSEFEECRPISAREDTPTSHPTLSHDQLSERALIVIQELKSVLRPFLGTFWLWNETLSGWNDNCNIFQKTSEFCVAFAVPVSNVPEMNLNSTFTGSEYLSLVEHHKWDDFHLQLVLDCYGLRISITVIYEDHDTMWNYEKDSTGNLIRNNYSGLRLCSTSVLGQLVHKPCSNQTSS